MKKTPVRLFEITSKIGVDDVVAKSGSGWRDGINSALPGLRAKVSKLLLLWTHGSSYP